MLRPLIALALTACTWIPGKDEDWREDPWGDAAPTGDPCDPTEAVARYAIDWYLDADEDTYGDASERRNSCEAPVGYVPVSGDCDDADPLVHPDAAETCDGTDEDCDALIDEEVAFSSWFDDADGDGYGGSTETVACLAPEGTVPSRTDCDDAVATTHPDAREACNEIDDDCDGQIDEGLAHTWFADFDGDGYGDPRLTWETCFELDGWTWDSTDCDDADEDVHPDAREQCNAIDDDCDGVLDDLLLWYVDADGDSFGDPAVGREDCEGEDGEVPNDADCDDAEPLAWEGAVETCDDDIDNDCDGVVDRGLYYLDTDADGLGDRDDAGTLSCGPIAGYSGYPWDCDDTDATVPLVVDPVDGLPGAAGTLDAPLAALQDAVDQGAACIVARPGTYAAAVELDGWGGELWGVGGSGETTIAPAGVTCGPTNPADCAPAVRITGGLAPTVRGFTVTGGTGAGTMTVSAETCTSETSSWACTLSAWRYCGGGVSVDGTDALLEDLSLVANVLPPAVTLDVSATERVTQASEGGGLCVRGGDVTATGVDAIGNAADVGGGMALILGTLALAQGHLSYNDAADGAGLSLSGADATLANVVVSCNTASEGTGGIAVDSDAEAILDFVTLAGNVATVDGAEVRVDNGGVVTLTDAIVQGASGYAALGGAGNVSWSVLGNDDGDTLDGGFTEGAGVRYDTGVLGAVGCRSFDADDYHLYAGSSAIDAADPTSAADTDGSPADAGAFGGRGGAWE